MHHQTNWHINNHGHNTVSSGTESEPLLNYGTFLGHSACSDLLHYKIPWHLAQIPLQGWYTHPPASERGKLLSRELSSANKSCLTWRLGGYITPPLPGSSRWPVTEWFKDTKVWSPWPQSGAILSCHSVTGVSCGNKIRLDCISTLIFTWLRSLFYSAPSSHCRCLPRALP